MLIEGSLGPANLDVNMSHSTLKRACQRAGLIWKRVRKSLKSKGNPVLVEQSRQQLETLIEQDKQGFIDLYYFDESGFTLEPCVPTLGNPSAFLPLKAIDSMYWDL